MMIFLSLISSKFVINFNCSIRFFLMMVSLLFIIGLMGLFYYNKRGSIIPAVDLPTTEIIEPFLVSKWSDVGQKLSKCWFFYNAQN